MTQPSETNQEQNLLLRTVGLLLLSGLIVGISVGGSMLLTSKLHVPLIMLLITSMAVLCSLVPAVNRVRWSYPLGFYLVLVFCCAIGSLLDVERLLTVSPAAVTCVLLMMPGSFVLHLLLARLCGIDRDTFLITSTAALYGPPFVPPVANAIGNPAILLSGLTTGLVGYALGSYVGIGLALLLG